MENPITVSPNLSYIKEGLQKQKEYFKTGATLDVEFRLKHLRLLKKEIEKREADIHQALYKDLKKSEPEAYITETGIVMKELDETIKKTRRWAKPRSVPTPMFFSPGSSKIHPEPYGTCLVISPWNYPFQLLFLPLIGAISAGNTVVCKPSECSAHTTQITKEIIEAVFEKQYVWVVEGAVPESTALLRERWDYIFFTGSTHVGRIVYQAAAKHLTPVTLELGGKSPCIVDKDINLENTANRIVWAKFLNVGQTCIAPDYMYVHEDIKDKLIAKIKEKISQHYSDSPQTSEDFGRIINERNFERLCSLIDGEKVCFGGQTDKDDLYISPTLMDNVHPDDAVMQEEIFGPILPIMTYKNIDDVIQYINSKEKPLALYVFSTNKSIVNKVLKNCSSGGATVNDAVLHIGNAHLPFGGVGESGIGAYHSQLTFDTFSHLKSVLHKWAIVDLSIRYAPWGKNFKWLKFLMKNTL